MLILVSQKNAQRTDKSDPPSNFTTGTIWDITGANRIPRHLVQIELPRQTDEQMDKNSSPSPPGPESLVNSESRPMTPLSRRDKLPVERDHTGITTAPVPDQSTAPTSRPVPDTSINIQTPAARNRKAMLLAMKQKQDKTKIGSSSSWPIPSFESSNIPKPSSREQRIAQLRQMKRAQDKVQQIRTSPGVIPSSFPPPATMEAPTSQLRPVAPVQEFPNSIPLLAATSSNVPGIHPTPASLRRAKLLVLKSAQDKVRMARTLSGATERVASHSDVIPTPIAESSKRRHPTSDGNIQSDHRISKKRRVTAKLPAIELPSLNQLQIKEEPQDVEMTAEGEVTLQTSSLTRLQSHCKSLEIELQPSPIIQTPTQNTRGTKGKSRDIKANARTEVIDLTGSSPPAPDVTDLTSSPAPAPLPVHHRKHFQDYRNKVYNTRNNAQLRPRKLDTPEQYPHNFWEDLILRGQVQEDFALEEIEEIRDLSNRQLLATAVSPGFITCL